MPQCKWCSEDAGEDGLCRHHSALTRMVKAEPDIVRAILRDGEPRQEWVGIEPTAWLPR